MSEPVATRTARAAPPPPAAAARAPVTAVGWTLAAAIALAGLWLAAPPMGTDLSAQVARADFFADHGWAMIDFRWYGGVVPHGYSLLSPALMAWLGPRPVGAASVVLSAVVFVLLLLRTRAPRPLLGGVLGAVCFTGNLVSGRVTFALGVALGLLALLALAPSRVVPSRAPLIRLRPLAGRPVGARRAAAVRIALAFVLAVLTAAASPVAGLFVALAGTALATHSLATHSLATHSLAPRSLASHSLGGAGRDLAWGNVGQIRAQDPSLPHQAGGGYGIAGGLALLLGAGAPMVVMAGLFGSGGWMNMSGADLTSAALASIVVAVLVPHRVVRIGAVLSAAGVVAAYLLPTAVGLNATRLATMFALPLVAAYATVPASMPSWLDRLGRRDGLGRLRSRSALWLAPVLVGLAAWQPPVVFQDLVAAGDPAASPGYYAPLREELANRQLAGRVEVVPTAHYWEAAYVDNVLLARGWLRQADTGRNPLFFDGTLDASTYRDWLADNGVSYVALPQAPVSWVGGREADLITRGLPYLTLVWANDDWKLYEVDGASAIIEGPATLAEASPNVVVFEASERGEILLRVRWSRWLTVAGPGEPCLSRSGDWVTVTVTEAGRYEITGALLAPGPRC